MSDHTPINAISIWNNQISDEDKKILDAAFDQAIDKQAKRIIEHIQKSLFEFNYYELVDMIGEAAGPSEIFQKLYSHIWKAILSGNPKGIHEVDSRTLLLSWMRDYPDDLKEVLDKALLAENESLKQTIKNFQRPY